MLGTPPPVCFCSLFNYPNSPPQRTYFLNGPKSFNFIDFDLAKHALVSNFTKISKISNLKIKMSLLGSKSCSNILIRKRDETSPIENQGTTHSRKQTSS